jgi:amino acid adenylation domain-containing protein
MIHEAIAGFRLSPWQARLWAAQQHDATYRSECVLRITGPVDPQALRTAIETVAARHEILRTTYHRRAGMKYPLQVIGDASSVDWNALELMPGDSRAQFVRLAEIQRDERTRPFDLERGPVLRATLVSLSGEQHRLLLSVPTLCGDGRSLAILADELRAIPAAGGPTAPDADPPLQYADFSEWHNQLVEGEEAGTSRESFWQRDDLVTAESVSLPFQLATRPDAPFSAERVALTVGGDVARRGLALAEQEGLALSDVLFACWQAVLARVSGRSHFVVRTLCDGRKQAELETAIGLFAQALPVPCHIENQPFLEIVRQAREATEASSQWLESFDGGDAAPGVQFEFRASATDHASSPFAIESTSCHLDRFVAKLSCHWTGDACELGLFYDSSLLESRDAERIVEYYVRLLEGVLLNPTAPVGSHEILSADERRHLVVSLNQTAEDYPRDSAIHELFERQAERVPDRPALVCRDRRHSYAELNARTNRLAHYLRERGVGPGVRVGLCMDRSDDMIVAVLAILKAGGAYLPLHPELPKPRLAYQIEEAGTPVVLTQEAQLGNLPEFRGDVLCIDRDEARWATLPATNPGRTSTPDDLVYVIYTSGSTGTPKGVAVRHRNLVNYASAIARKLAANDDEPLVFATVSTLSADLGNTCIFPSLISGGCLHVVPYETAMDGTSFASYVSRNPVDVLKITPSHLNALLAGQTAAAVLPRKYLVLGGEASSWDLVRRVNDAKTCRVLNHYGPTETTVGSLTFSTWDHMDAAASSATVPVGRPIANSEVYLLDAQGQPVPLGVPGELCIGGAGVSEGYLNKPEQTADRFVRNPFSNDASARLYRTGDRARYLRDGNVEFLGRIDEQVKIRGFRVEPAEIAEVLRRHSAVAQAVVVAQDDAAGEKRLAAYFVKSGGATPAPEDLRAFLATSLPDYMVPAAFVPLDKLPLTPNGKLDRRALPDPEQARLASANAYVAPRNPAEESLAAIWREVLGVERVGVTDNFFELGGHSLLGTQVISRVRNAFQIELQLRTLFETPTVAGMVEAIAQYQPREAEDNEVGRMLAELEGLSEEEIQELLALETQGGD